ncbi:MAG: hypothetical protein V4606_01815 [Patescibacteria group bacterium]
MKNTTILALVLGVQLAILHALAVKFSLYWEIAWFDNLMHLFGGVVLALLLYTLVDIKLLGARFVTSWRRVTALLVLVLLGWEVLGVIMLMRVKENFISDTSLDLLFGAVGCVMGWFIGRQLKK